MDDIEIETLPLVFTTKTLAIYDESHTSYKAFKSMDAICFVYYSDVRNQRCTYREVMTVLVHLQFPKSRLCSIWFHYFFIVSFFFFFLKGYGMKLIFQVVKSGGPEVIDEFKDIKDGIVRVGSLFSGPFWWQLLQPDGGTCHCQKDNLGCAQIKWTLNCVWFKPNRISARHWFTIIASCTLSDVHSIQ